MDHRGFGLFLGAIFEGLLALFCLPLRLIAWALREDDPAAEVDAAAQAYRDAAAVADKSEREPVAQRENLAQAMRAYLRREKSLGDLKSYGNEAAVWALAARHDGLTEAEVPQDDAAFEVDVLATRLVSPASAHDMRRALRRFAELPSHPTPVPTYADAAPAPTFMM